MKREYISQNILELIKKRARKAHGKKIVPCEFQVGDLVLEENHHNSQAKKQDKGKLETNQIGPYIIKNKYPNNAYMLAAFEGKVNKFSTNAKHLNPFYA